jgi:hypothetical protein
MIGSATVDTPEMIDPAIRGRSKEDRSHPSHPMVDIESIQDSTYCYRLPRVALAPLADPGLSYGIPCSIVEQRNL